MSKTPEEIKKGLSEPELFCSHCQHSGEPHGCNRQNGTCQAFDNADNALDYIQQLEANDSQVKKALRDNGFQTLEALLQAYSQVKRERDALENDLYSVVNDYVTPCFCCKIFDSSTTVCDHEGVDCFIWRGVQEQPEGDEHGT